MLEVSVESLFDRDSISSPKENVGMLDQTPPIRDADTPNNSFNSLSDGSGLNTSMCGSENESSFSQNDTSANNLLKDIRIKNVNRLIIGTLNINFIAPKFDVCMYVCIYLFIDVYTINKYQNHFILKQNQ